MHHFDRNKSLEQLEGKEWGEATYGSYLVTECHRLRLVPLREFTPENLRIMIGQQIGLPYLIPLAFELLHADPFTAGDYYEGDLLAAMLRAEATFWRVHPELQQEAAEIAEQAFTLLYSFDECDQLVPWGALTEAHHAFQRAHTTAI